MESKRYIVTEGTGEVTELNAGDRIMRKKSIEHLSEYETWSMKHFYKGNSTELRKLMPELSIYEKGILFSILPYIDYKSCVLSHQNGIDLSLGDIEKKSAVGRKKCGETVAMLIKKDILYRGKNSKGTQYFVNPWLFVKGNEIEVVLKTMFKNYKIKIHGNVKWKDL